MLWSDIFHNTINENCDCPIKPNYALMYFNSQLHEVGHSHCPPTPSYIEETEAQREGMIWDHVTNQ